MKRVGPGRRKKQAGSKLSFEGKNAFAVSKRSYLWMKRPRPEVLKQLDKDLLLKDRRVKERRSGKDRRS